MHHYIKVNMMNDNYIINISQFFGEDQCRYENLYDSVQVCICKIS